MYTKTIRNLTYEIRDDYAVVTACDTNATSVVVLTEVEGKPVTEIGDCTFYGCESLESIAIPNSVTQIGYGTFVSCESLKGISIPDSVNKIGEYAFFGCKSLKKITIPNSITEIRKWAFCDCPSLTEVTIPDNIKKIDKTAFKNCSNIQKVKFSQALANRTDSKKIFEQMVNAGLCTYEVIFQEPAL